MLYKLLFAPLRKLHILECVTRTTRTTRTRTRTTTTTTFQLIDRDARGEKLLEKCTVCLNLYSMLEFKVE